MKRFLLAIGLSGTVILSAMAQGMPTVREGVVWDYSDVSSNLDGVPVSASPMKGFHFDGSCELNGKEYKIFRDGNGKAIGLMRQEGAKIYTPALSENAPVNGDWVESDVMEVVLYDFDAKEGDSFQSILHPWYYGCGGIDSLPYAADLAEMKVAGCDSIEINGEICRRQIIEAYCYTDQPHHIYTVIEGIGSLNGVLCSPVGYPLVSGGQPTTEFVSLSKDGGEVIFKRADIDPTGFTVNEYLRWNYTVETRIGDQVVSSEPDGNYHFDGVVKADGKPYMQFRNGKDEVVALMREEEGAVYLHLDYDMRMQLDYWMNAVRQEPMYAPTEIVLYDFNLQPGDRYISIGYGEADSDKLVMSDIEVNSVFSQKLNACSFKGQLIDNDVAILSRVGISRGYLHKPQPNPLETEAEQKVAVIESLTLSGIYAMYTREDLNGILTGVEAVEAAAPAIGYAGGVITADGLDIEVYDMAGKQAARGNGEVPTEALQPGVYVAKAGAAARKIIVR